MEGVLCLRELWSIEFSLPRKRVGNFSVRRRDLGGGETSLVPSRQLIRWRSAHNAAVVNDEDGSGWSQAMSAPTAGQEQGRPARNHGRGWNNLQSNNARSFALVAANNLTVTLN